MQRRSIVPVFLLAFAGLACDGRGPGGPGSSSRPGTRRPGVAEVEAPPDDRVADRRLVYVPVYSHVFTGDNRQPLNLAATLFVRNVEPGRSIVVTRVDYFDSGGKLLREFLAKPLELGPLASMDFFVEESDVSGGASPSFLVHWVATERVSDPVVESVMIGTSGTQGISFVGAGRVINPPKP